MASEELEYSGQFIYTTFRVSWLELNWPYPFLKNNCAPMVDLFWFNYSFKNIKVIPRPKKLVFWIRMNMTSSSLKVHKAVN